MRKRSIFCAAKDALKHLKVLQTDLVSDISDREHCHLRIFTIVYLDYRVRRI